MAEPVSMVPDVYLKNFSFSRSTRYVVRPQRTVHIIMVENYGNGQIYVAIEEMKDGVWGMRKDVSPQGFSNMAQAKLFAAQLHKAETRAGLLRASLPENNGPAT